MQTERTTLNLPTQLIREAQKQIGAKTKTEAIILSLKEAIRHKKLIKYAKELGGTDNLQLTQLGLKKLRKNRMP